MSLASPSPYLLQKGKLRLPEDVTGVRALSQRALQPSRDRPRQEHTWGDQASCSSCLPLIDARFPAPVRVSPPSAGRCRH